MLKVKIISEEESLEKKDVVGLVEEITIKGNNGKTLKVKALFDTGATRTSVDVKLARKLELGPIEGEVLVKSKTERHVRRILVPCEFNIKGRNFKKTVNISSRKNMFTPVLIGRDIIHGNFVIDIEKSHDSHLLRSIK